MRWRRPRPTRGSGLIACEVFDTGLCSLLSRLVPDASDPADRTAAAQPAPLGRRRPHPAARAAGRLPRPACSSCSRTPGPRPGTPSAASSIPAQVPLVARVAQARRHLARGQRRPDLPGLGHRRDGRRRPCSTAPSPPRRAPRRLATHPLRGEGASRRPRAALLVLRRGPPHRDGAARRGGERMGMDGTAVGPADESRALTGLRGVAALLVMVHHFYLHLAAGPAPAMLGVAAAQGLPRASTCSSCSAASSWRWSMAPGSTAAAAGLRSGVPPCSWCAALARLWPLHAVDAGLVVAGAIAWLGMPARARAASLANLAMIQAWGLSAEINPPAWSISTELLAYLLFPAARRRPAADARCGAWLAVRWRRLSGGRRVPASAPPVGPSRRGALDIYFNYSLLPVLRCLAGFMRRDGGLAAGGIGRGLRRSLANAWTGRPPWRWPRSADARPGQRPGDLRRCCPSSCWGCISAVARPGALLAHGPAVPAGRAVLCRLPRPLRAAGWLPVRLGAALAGAAGLPRRAAGAWPHCRIIA